jgi:hypothetical protein
MGQKWHVNLNPVVEMGQKWHINLKLAVMGQRWHVTLWITPEVPKMAHQDVPDLAHL